MNDVINYPSGSSATHILYLFPFKGYCVTTKDVLTQMPLFVLKTSEVFSSIAFSQHQFQNEYLHSLNNSFEFWKKLLFEETKKKRKYMKTLSGTLSHLLGLKQFNWQFSNNIRQMQLV